MLLTYICISCELVVAQPREASSEAASLAAGRLAQRIMFCQAQELNLENEASPTVAQPPGTLFRSPRHYRH